MRTKEEKNEYGRQYYWLNRDEVLQKTREKRLIPIERAKILLASYNRNDENHKRGNGNLTPEWIADNIFTKPCVHCGESDWTKLGCNRINNDLPHTIDNVEPCCFDCNMRLAGDDKSKLVYQYTIDGKLVNIWPSTEEVARKIEGVYQPNIVKCCNGIRKTCGGFKWSYQYEA